MVCDDHVVASVGGLLFIENWLELCEELCKVI